MACFDDLPNELLLIICSYLTPIHVLKAFMNYNSRLFCCIRNYHTNVNFTKYSYADFQDMVKRMFQTRLHPSDLTVSNVMVPSQVSLFMVACGPSDSYCRYVQRLELIDCTKRCRNLITIYINYFRNLQSLRIVEAMCRPSSSSIDYSAIENWRDLIFVNKFYKLSELELTTQMGIILDKQLRSNTCLQHLTISLSTIDDLFVLLDDLIPNLITLNVILCQSRIRTRSPLPPMWARHPMCHMTTFRLTINEQVNVSFDLLHDVVAPLTQLDSFSLIVQGPTSDVHFTQGDQIEMLLDRCLARLRHFSYYVRTSCQADMQTFIQLTERWPMACQITSNHSYSYLYTISWPLEECSLSMLAKDDTISICSNVTSLVVDIPCHDMNLSHRFPHIHTLTVQATCTPGLNGFRRLRHLITHNMKLISCLAQQIDTLTLTNVNSSSFTSLICSNVHHLTISKFFIDDVNIITSLQQCFPNLHSLHVQFRSNCTVFRNSLDLLFNAQQWPKFKLLRTNWIERSFRDYKSIKVWIADNTELKSRSIPFHADCDGESLIVWL